MHCCIDKELESIAKLQIKLKPKNPVVLHAQYHHEQQQQRRHINNLYAAITENLKENGCLNVNFINRTIPISSVTITISTATCLRLMASPTQLPSLNVNSRMNFGIGDSIRCVQIHFDCTATTIMFLPLYQQTHCQSKKLTSVPIETAIIRFVNINGVDSIAQSMCTNQMKLTTIKLVEANTMNAINENVSQTLDQCKAIKLKTNEFYTERPNNNQINATKANGHHRFTPINYCVGADEQSGDLMANTFTSIRQKLDEAERGKRQTERRHHYSKLPNNFTNVNTLYIDYRKMFCTFLLPLLLLVCNLTPLINAGEYEQIYHISKGIFTCA